MMIDKYTDASWVLGTRVNYTKNNWVDLLIDSDEVPYFERILGHKTIIALPGNGSSPDNKSIMNGFVKRASQVLSASGSNEVPEIYSVAYHPALTEYHRLSVLFEAGAVDYTKDAFSVFLDKDREHHFQSMASAIFRPVLFNKDMTPRPFAEAKKHLGNITFFAFCHGSVLLKFLENEFEKMAKEIHPENYQELVRQLKGVNLHSRAPFSQELKGRYLHLISQDDYEFADDEVSHNAIHRFLHETPFEDETLVVPFSQNELVFLLKDLNFKKKSRDAHEAQLDTLVLPIDENQTTYEGDDKRLKQNAKTYKLLALTQALLRHFVENPADERSLEEIIHALSPETAQSQGKGKAFIQDWQERVKKEKEVLSLAGELSHIGQIQYTPQPAHKLLQSDTENQILYLRLFNQYKSEKGQSFATRQNLYNILSAVVTNLPNKALKEGVCACLKYGDRSSASLYMRALEKRYMSYINRDSRFIIETSLEDCIYPSEIKDTLLALKAQDLPFVAPLIKTLNFKNTQEDIAIMRSLIKKMAQLPVIPQELNQALKCALESGARSALYKNTLTQGKNIEIALEYATLSKKSGIGELSANNIFQDTNIYYNVFMQLSNNEEKRSAFIKLLDQVDFHSTSNFKYAEDLNSIEQKLLPHEKSSVLTSKIQELQQQDSDYTRLFKTYKEAPTDQKNKKELIHFLKTTINKLPCYQLLFALQDVVQNKDWQILQILMVELKNRAYNKSLSLSNKKIDLQSVRDIFEDIEAKDISHLLPILDYLEPDKLISPRNIKTLSEISQKVQDNPKDKDEFARIMISAMRATFISIITENNTTPKGESIQDPLSKENISKARKEMEKIFSKPGAEYLLEIYQKCHFQKQDTSIRSLWLHKKKNATSY